MRPLSLEHYVIKYPQGPTIIGILRTDATADAVRREWRTFRGTPDVHRSLAGFEKWLRERGFTADVIDTSCSPMELPFD